MEALASTIPGDRDSAGLCVANIQGRGKGWGLGGSLRLWSLAGSKPPSGEKAGRGWWRADGTPTERLPTLRRWACSVSVGRACQRPHVLSVFQPNSSNDNIQSITSGDWDVTKILSYDEKRDKM